MSLVVVDADVLGRRRTGDETYVRNLLRTLSGPAAEAGLDLAAVTRRPDLVPEGVLPVLLSARSQELRMAWTLPRALRRLGAALVHTQYALPLRCPCPAVVTIHDLSFERGRWAGATASSSSGSFRGRRAAPRASSPSPSGRSTTSSSCTRSRRSGSSSPRTASTRPSRAAEGASNSLLHGPYALAVGAIQERKNQLAALAAAREAGLELVVVGPTKDETIAGELRAGGARLEGTSPPSGSRRSTAPPPASSKHRATRASVSRSSRPWPPGRPS